MYGTKKLQHHQITGGPGIQTYENRQNQTHYLNGEQIDLETITTSLNLDQGYLQMQIQMIFDSILKLQLQEMLAKMIQQRVSLDYIVWDDKGSLTTRVLVDGKCVLEKSVELPLMEVASEHIRGTENQSVEMAGPERTA